MNRSQLVLVLRQRRAFRWLFFGMLFSRTGDTVGLVALSWLTLSVSGPQQLGVILFAGGIASAVSSQSAGHLVDRFGVRPVLLADNLIRAAVMSSVPILIWTHSLHLGYLYAA